MFVFLDSFATDAAISGKFNGRSFQEKQLEPWTGDSASGDLELALEENSVRFCS